MDINKLHKALDELMIASQEEKMQRQYQSPPMKRPMNNYNPENYYPNPNNISNKNVNYYATPVNPNSLASDDYYNDDYYYGDSQPKYSNSNINNQNDYYATKGSSYSGSQSSLGSQKDKKMRNFEQLKIKTHSRNQSSSSDQLSPRIYNGERRGSQDTVGSSLFSPVSSFSQSSASVNEPMTASIKTDISAVTLQTLSFDLVSGFLNRITSSAGFIKNSKRYYFVLDSDGLYYFKSNDPFARAKGFIKFDTKTKIKDIKENSSAKDKSSRILELEVFKDNKMHQVVLQAEDPEDRDMWHRALKKMIIRQKYVNESLPPLPQTPKLNSNPIPIASPMGHSRNQSQSSRHSPSQSQNMPYTQQIRISQKMYHDNNYDAGSLSKKSSLQNISDINLTAPNMYALQNRRRPSFDIQMLHQKHSRTSSINSLGEANNRQRYSYGSNLSNSNQSLVSNYFN